eukprot:scaffold27473_cov118-Isochrysis_galbana.AAC.3
MQHMPPGEGRVLLDCIWVDAPHEGRASLLDRHEQRIELVAEVVRNRREPRLRAAAAQAAALGWLLGGGGGRQFCGHHLGEKRLL